MFVYVAILFVYISVLKASNQWKTTENLVLQIFKKTTFNYQVFIPTYLRLGRGRGGEPPVNTGWNSSWRREDGDSLSYGSRGRRRGGGEEEGEGEERGSRVVRRNEGFGCGERGGGGGCPAITRFPTLSSQICKTHTISYLEPPPPSPNHTYSYNTSPNYPNFPPFPTLSPPPILICVVVPISKISSVSAVF